MQHLCLDHEERNLEAIPQTISYGGPRTLETGNERADGHRRHGCPWCSEEALPERCPGFRLDWLC